MGNLTNLDNTVLVSAFRKECEYSENLARNVQLRYILAANGFTVRPETATGGYVEEGGRVLEQTLIVERDFDSVGVREILSIAKMFQQESVLAVMTKSSYLEFANGGYQAMLGMVEVEDIVGQDFFTIYNNKFYVAAEA